MKIKRNFKLIHYALIVSGINLLLYNRPFYSFVNNNIDTWSLSGFLLVLSLLLLGLVLNTLVFYTGLYLMRRLGKWLLVLFFNINAIAVYFINTYGVIIDRSMISNVMNTNYEESSSFLSFTLMAYFLILGVIPSILIYMQTISYGKLKPFLIRVVATLVFIVILVYVNASNWLWIDKNSKTLGGLVMPWSYVVNTFRYFHHENQKNKEQILLPDATITDNEKSVMILVIGESARLKNFSLYGYEKETNPLLSKINNIHTYRAESCATSTTGGLKCMLEYKNTGKLYEILPNYLFRNGVDVIWRTTNWGEPKVNIPKYLDKQALRNQCQGDYCKYDDVLLNGLKEQILASKKNKILVVLHTSTSHGPSYYKKYPPEFNTFTPVCKSVELATCTNEELINAYDNTIVYTDFLLAALIDDLRALKDYKSSMMFVSDHGESLGENNLYMHGMPKSISPEEQYEIPFILWLSDSSKTLKDEDLLSQHHVFHSVLDFLAIDSPIYDKQMSIFKD